MVPRLYIACAPRRITRRILRLRVVRFGTVLDLRTTTWQKCGAVPRRARIEGSQTCVSLNPRLESNEEEKKRATQCFCPFMFAALIPCRNTCNLSILLQGNLLHIAIFISNIKVSV